MNKNVKNTLLPELRFPEFIDFEQWESKTLKELTPKGEKFGIVDGPFGSNLKTIHYKTEGIPIITSGYVTDGIFKADKYLFVTEEKFRKEKRSAVKAGDIVMAKIGARCGASAILPMDHKTGILSGNSLKITIDESRFSTRFVWQQLWYLHISLKLQVLIKAGAQPAISIANLKKFELLLPKKKEEQQKIADCLSSLDELITAQSQKLDALKNHKIGLLQNLFPAEGETLPELRFPEFEDDGDWIEKTLGQVVHYENGKAHEKDIDEQGNFIVVNSKFISTDGEVKKYTNTANLLAKEGDILMVLSDVPNGRAIAKCFYVDKDDTYTVNQRVCKLTSKKAVSLVLYYLINRNSYFLAFDDGAKQTNLRKDDVLNCPLLLPKNPKEQQKIANCLSSIDELIKAQSQKIEALKAHKKGLMQQLFPNTNQLTNE
ncbi:MAG: restriction endonuclease subunit S [Prolixibacteraceae bacterium]|nr:restriction endonuclease subunit S [Prolixibacteraceae bacterium]